MEDDNERGTTVTRKPESTSYPSPDAPIYDVHLMLVTTTVFAIGLWIMIFLLVFYALGESKLREPVHAIAPILLVIPAIILTILAGRYLQGAKLRKLGVSFDSEVLCAYGCRTKWERIEVLYNDEESPHVILLFGNPKEPGNVWKLSKKDISSLSHFIETAESKGIRVIRELP